MGGRWLRGLQDAILDPMDDADTWPAASLERDPTIEAYKVHVDRTILRENLRLTTQQRIEKMLAAARMAEAVRRSTVRQPRP